MVLVTEIPRNIARAFYGYDEWDIEAFASRWGGLHTAVFERALAEGQGEDKVQAIFAIGYLETPWAQERMWTLVESPQRKERWASAVCLGAMHDERATPYLQRILLEGLDPEEPFDPEDENWYAVKRDDVARLLSSWGPSTVVTTLRQSFLAVNRLREARPCPKYLFVYQDTLAYALGQRGALGALTGVALTEPQRRVAMIYLSLGLLRADERYPDMGAVSMLIVDQNLKQEVAEVLAQQFGLSEDERLTVISMFGRDSRRRKAETRGSTSDETDDVADEMDEAETE